MGEIPGPSGAETGERRRPHAAFWATVCTGIILGIVAEAASFGLADPENWIPDLIVGWVCIGCGVLIAVRQPRSRTGILLVVAGLTWFIGNFSGVPVGWIAALAAQLTLTHRAVLMHVALTVPSGRITGFSFGVILLAYLVSSIPATTEILAVTIALNGLVAAAAARSYLTSPPPLRTARLVGLTATVLLGSVFTMASLVHAAVPSGEADRLVLFINQATIVFVVAGLTLATLLPRLRVGQMIDLLVAASRSRSGFVRHALARAIGDPSLEVAYWHPASNRYLDATGETVPVPHDTDARAVLRVDLDDRPAAVLVHDPAALEISALADAVSAATALASANARLRNDVLDQLAEVRASRRRLLLAADAARARLRHRLGSGPLKRSEDLSTSLERIQAASAERGTTAVTQQVSRARSTLAKAREELDALAQGLHPAAVAVEGLEGALRALADRSPVPVNVTYTAGDVPEPVALGIYYACTEAITNAAKHADPSVVGLKVWEDASHVCALISDDGQGGADPSSGSGLRGIQDRIEALDGTVLLTSEAGAGTRLLVLVPL